MRYIIIFLVSLKAHPILSLLGLIVLGVLAIDGQENVYIHSFDKIHQFNTSGKFIGILPNDPLDGASQNVYVDNVGFVYTVTTDGKVLKYKIKEKD